MDEFSYEIWVPSFDGGWTHKDTKNVTAYSPVEAKKRHRIIVVIIT